MFQRAVLGCAVMLVGCDAGYGATKTANAAVQIENKAGSAKLVGQPGLVVPTVVFTPRGLSEEEIPHHFQVSQELADGVIRVLIERAPKDAHNTDMFLDVTVTAPPDGFFQEDTPHGDGLVQDMTGGGQIRAQGGNVTANNVKGTLEMEALHDVTVTGHSCGDTLRMLSNQGDISVEVAPECEADLRASAPDGVDVKNVDFKGISAETAVLGRIKAKGKRIDAAAEKGAITFKNEAPAPAPTP